MAFWSRFFGRTRQEQELEDEINAHLSIEVQQRIERGESVDEARSNARRDFGNVTLVKETTRDAWSWIWVDRLLGDQRYIARRLRHNAGFTGISIFTLAVGLAAITTMFTIINSVVLEPLKYAQPDGLYSAVNVPPARAQSSRYWPVNARHFHEWRSHCQSCEDVALAEGVGFTLIGSGEPERFPGFRVSYNFFRTLGVQPALGRDFRPEEEFPGQFHEVILADSLWHSRFGGDPDIMGRALQINGEPFIVIGIMPPGFQLPVGNQWGPAITTATAQPLMFRPLGQDVSQARAAGNNNFICVVRLRPGAQASQATAEFEGLIADYVKQFNIELKTALLPLHEVVTRSARAPLWLLLATGVAVWLMVCVNVANLVLVHTAGRDREAGIRMALGSTRGELFRLVLNEAFALVVIGSAVGMLMTYVGLRMFVARAPADLPRLGDIQVDSHVWLLATATAAISTLLCGLIPAWQLASRPPQQALQAGSVRSTAHRRKVRFRELMIAAEVALSTVLLSVGALLMMSFLHVMQVPRGFETTYVITQDVSLSAAKYDEPGRIRFIDDALVRLGALPGVRSVGVTNQTPLRGETWICGLRDAGPPDQHELTLANIRFVNPGYWSALGIPLKKGRLLEETDRKRPVAVIDERAAQLLWPGLDPIGRRLGSCGPNRLNVIGVVGAVRADLERDAPLTVYQPYWTESISRPFFVLRTNAELATIAGSIRRALRSVDAEVPISRAMNMESVLDEATAVRRFQMNLAIAFAVVALFLAALGIYGVVSFTVAQRTSEIGIRMTLGARTPELITMILRRGLVPVLAGLSIGLGSAFLTGQFIKSQLFGVAPNDPLTMFVVSILLLLVAICACCIPAWRATRIRPLEALRSE